MRVELLVVTPELARQWYALRPDWQRSIRPGQVQRLALLRGHVKGSFPEIFDPYGNIAEWRAATI